MTVCVLSAKFCVRDREIGGGEQQIGRGVVGWGGDIPLAKQLRGEAEVGI